MIAVRLLMLTSLVGPLGCHDDAAEACIDEAEFGVTMNSFAVSASETLAVVDITVTTVSKDPCDDEFGGGRALNSVRLDDFSSTAVIGGLTGFDLVVPPSRDVAIWADGDNLGMVDMTSLAVSTIDLSNWGSADVPILLSDGTIAFPLNGSGSFIGVFDAQAETTTFNEVPWEPYRLVEGNDSLYAALIGTAGIAEISPATWSVVQVIPNAGPYAVVALQATNLSAYVRSSGDAFEIDTVTGATTFLAAPKMSIDDLAYLAPHRWLGFVASSNSSQSFLLDFDAGTVTTLPVGPTGKPILIAERGELFLGESVIDVATGEWRSVVGGSGAPLSFFKRLSDGRVIGVRDVGLPRGNAPSSVNDVIRILDPALDYEVVGSYPLTIPPEF